MKDLVEYIVKNIVSDPDKVVVDEQSSGSDLTLLLTVDPKDMGIVIGKGGQMIKAIRRVLTVRAINDNVRVNLQLNEPESNGKSQPIDSELSDTTPTKTESSEE